MDTDEYFHADGAHWIGWASAGWVWTETLPPGARVLPGVFTEEIVNWVHKYVPLTAAAVTPQPGELPGTAVEVATAEVSSAGTTGGLSAMASRAGIQERARQASQVANAGSRKAAAAAARSSRKAADVAVQSSKKATETMAPHVGQVATAAARSSRKAADVAVQSSKKATETMAPHVGQAASATKAVTMRSAGYVKDRASVSVQVRRETRLAIKEDRAAFELAGGRVPGKAWTLWTCLGIVGGHRMYVMSVSSGVARASISLVLLLMSGVMVVAVNLASRATTDAWRESTSAFDVVGSASASLDQGFLLVAKRPIYALATLLLILVVFLWLLDAYLLNKWLFTLNRDALTDLGRLGADPPAMTATTAVLVETTVDPGPEATLMLESPPADSADDPVETVVTCGACARVASPGAAFCPACGHRLTPSDT